ncbi:MAG: bifunctional pyr operon transcriptional regulator/uracil phosphoribosyltransferase PyrR [Bacteroidetes bacterium]|nr:MAG: bifunctional pyr operon transcriptional regulator/uracil phosphoribosyltransferase PyrR [Bacteroidota bacterium]
MQKRLLLDLTHFEITIKRLCCQLIENHDDFSNSVIIGLQPRGVFLAHRIHKNLQELTGIKNIALGELDVTFYRDDFRRREINAPSETRIDFSIADKKVILIDDVLFTGRTIRSGMDAMLDIGRPAKVELMVLVNRRYSRHLPIEPDYVGIQVDTIRSEKVIVEWKETDGKDAVWLLTE